jgi:hypothetical protein
MLIFAKTLEALIADSFGARQGRSKRERLGALLGYFLPRSKK